MRGAVVFFAAVAVSFGASGEDTIRCRNGRLVNVGMTASEVSSRCGQPTSRTREEIPVMARLPTGAVRQTGENVGVTCATALTADLQHPAAPIQEPFRAVLDPLIVIKKCRSS